MTEEKPDLDSDETRVPEELVPADDAVIGRAFRLSLLGLAAVAVIVALVLLWPESSFDSTNREIEVLAPEEVSLEAQPPTVAFVDHTAASGVDFVHINGAYGAKLLPETMGSGVAVFDFDADADQDLFFVNATRWPHAPGDSPRGTLALYANDGHGNFVDVSRQRGIDHSLYGTGVAIGDYDGDGDRDIFVSAVGSNLLLRSENGGQTFTDVTEEAGVAGGSDQWSSSCGFVDIDNDGDLDLVVTNYVRWSPEIDLALNYRLTGVGRAYGPPTNYEGTFLYLYRNDGDGRFSDISASSGVEISNPATGGPVAKSLGLAPVDVNEDGWMDFFVANDTTRNFLFMNRGGGLFEEEGELQGVAYGRQGNATGAMGVDSALFRDDGELAFLVANFANEMSSLYVSQGDRTLYSDEAIVEGLGAPSRRMLSFGVFFFDYDLDGRLDLLQANGHLEEEINSVDPSQFYRQATQLFWNGGAAGLIPVSPESTSDLALPLVGRAAAYGDLDGDGDLDVVITQTGDRPLIFRNDQATGHHYLRVEARGNGTTSNRDGIGAWIEVESGGSTQRRQVMPTRSFQSQVELPVTFGLGTAESIDGLRITWPDGTQSEHLVDGVDRLLVIEQP